jgi:hypothetical protein
MAIPFDHQARYDRISRYGAPSLYPSHTFASSDGFLEPGGKFGGQVRHGSVSWACAGSGGTRTRAGSFCASNSLVTEGFSAVPASLAACPWSDGSWTPNLFFPFWEPYRPPFPTSSEQFSTRSAKLAAASLARDRFTMSDKRQSRCRTSHIPGYFASGTTRTNSVRRWHTTQATPSRLQLRSPFARWATPRGAWPAWWPGSTPSASRTWAAS